MSLMLPRTGLVIFLSFVMTAAVGCTGSTEVVTRHHGGVTRYPFTSGGFVTAAFWGDQTAVQQFLVRGMDVNAVDVNGDTALHAAVDGRNELVVRLLLEAGADPNIQNDRGYTVLMLAAANNDRWTVETLLEAGADPSIRNNEGDTAADIAQSLGNTEVLDLLLSGR
ncbi:MAG: ankyrin repeat domain-containing protein [Firmicutes bacterium]|nr:ankyrin repeat domain-containing protein [Bacillota bacterium]